MAFADLRKTVAAAATAERLSSTSIAFRSLVITAETDNTGVVVYGGSTVVAALSTRRGTPLAAGESKEFLAEQHGVDDLRDIFLDVTVSGDGVTASYVTR